MDYLDLISAVIYVVMLILRVWCALFSHSICHAVTEMLKPSEGYKQCSLITSSYVLVGFTLMDIYSVSPWHNSIEQKKGLENKACMFTFKYNEHHF